MNKSPFSSNSLREHECREFARHLGAYLDGELDAGKLLEIEGHVAGCESCRERVELDRAMRGTLKKVVQKAAAAPLVAHDSPTEEGVDPRAAMRARMAAAMT